MIQVTRRRHHEPRPRRAYIDLSAVPAHQREIDRRLENWARTQRNSPRREGTPSPMFASYQSPARVRAEYGALTIAPPDHDDARRIRMAIAMLAERHRLALDWHYLHPRKPAARAAQLGTDVAGLRDLVVEARDVLIARGV